MTIRSNWPLYTLLLLLLLVFALSFANPAIAYASAWLTNTSTLEPYFSTPTAWPTYACSTAWENPYPTNTSVPYTPIFETVTPAATSTAGATATPGVTGVQYEAIFAGPITASKTVPHGQNQTDIQVGTYVRSSAGPILAVEIEYIATVPSLVNSFSGGAIRVGSFGGGWGSDPIMGGDVSWWTKAGYVVSSPVIAIPVYGATFWGQSGLPGAAMIWGSEAAYDSFVAGTGRTRVTNLASPPENDEGFTIDYLVNIANQEGSSRSISATFLVTGIWYWGVPLATPTATPDPSAPQCAGLIWPTPAPVDLGISLPVPYVGDASCFVPIPPIEQAIPEFLQGVFGVEELAFPGLQVCLRNIYFGNLELGITTISADFIATLLGGVALIRWFLRTAT